MPRDNCGIYTKEEYLAFLKKAIPDEAIVITPAWGLHGDVKAEDGKGAKWHAPYMSIRAHISPDVLLNPRDASSLMQFSGDILLWMTKEEDARKYLALDHLRGLMEAVKEPSNAT